MKSQADNSVVKNGYNQSESATAQPANGAPKGGFFDRASAYAKDNLIIIYMAFTVLAFIAMAIASALSN